MKKLNFKNLKFTLSKEQEYPRCKFCGEPLVPGQGHNCPFQQ